MDILTAIAILAAAPVDWSLGAGAVWTAAGCMLAAIITGVLVGMQR
jgi:hypothetical protein